MFSKKIIAVLLAVGVVASTSAIFNEINIKGAFADTIKQNVVYTKNDTTAISKDEANVTGAEAEAYQKKALDAAKKYFNISFEENEKIGYNVSIINEKNLDQNKVESTKLVQANYDNKVISKKDYDKQMAEVEEDNVFGKERCAALKHGIIEVSGYYNGKYYNVEFNENTKEIENVTAGGGNSNESDTVLTISEDQLKKTAENYIKQYKLGDIEKPKCILVKEGKNRLYYQDENDASKKAAVTIDQISGAVCSFSLKDQTDFEYNMESNSKFEKYII